MKFSQLQLDEIDQCNSNSELEKAARDVCGHFAWNHGLLRTFWA